ncbi:MAG: hypothetical protein AMJ53_09370 [Gammaproteobacteria bacterium SG8_11]|nr:MAG: hypothetical protein AMJ53_09370 [Gammaproteobacteria bacterium SG8_11]
MGLYKLNNWALVLLIALLSACGGGGGDDSEPTDDVITFNLDCSAAMAYSPSNAPNTIDSTNGIAGTTLIVLHGKTGTPYGGHLQSFYSGMAAQGYDVIAPYMPWSGTSWDGDLCEAMAYIDQLAEAEIAQGKDVVVVGHSMGGVHALIYGATEPPAGVKAIVPIAPGHMPHQAIGFQNTVAADVSRAKTLVANGDGNTTGYSFITPNNGIKVTLNTTPNIYLSYHSLDQFPDIRGVLPLIEIPVFWVAGNQDNLTTTYNMAGLFGEINSANSKYEPLEGTHSGVVANTPTPLGAWLSGLGI